MISSKSIKSNNCQPRILSPVKTSFKNKDEIETFSDTQNREPGTSRPSLKKVLKDILYKKRKRIPGLRCKKEIKSKEMVNLSKSKLSWTQWQWIKKHFKDGIETHDDQIFLNNKLFLNFWYPIRPKDNTPRPPTMAWGQHLPRRVLCSSKKWPEVPGKRKELHGAIGGRAGKTVKCLYFNFFLVVLFFLFQVHLQVLGWDLGFSVLLLQFLDTKEQTVRCAREGRSRCMLDVHRRHHFGTGTKGNRHLFLRD